jgi:hypothetical protein
MPELALVAALLMAATPAPKLSAMEQRYIEVRDAATARFAKGEGPGAAERQAMDGLEAQLGAIVGPVRASGLTGPGKLAYEGFWGVGSTPAVADGVVFSWRSDTLFVTTRALYTRSAAAAHSNGVRPADEMISRTVIGGHAAYVTFADLPVRKGASTERVRATVGVATQDDGPWPPNYLVVQLERGERVFVVGASLKPPLEQVAECEHQFNADWRKIASGTGDTERLRAGVYGNYRRCVGATLPSRPSFTAALARAQAIVDQLEAGDGAGPPAGR